MKWFRHICSLKPKVISFVILKKGNEYKNFLLKSKTQYKLCFFSASNKHTVEFLLYLPESVERNFNRQPNFIAFRFGKFNC
jgi:hypothetical protein